MSILLTVGLVVAVALIGLVLSLRIVKQYEPGVLLRLGRVLGVRPAGLTFIIPFVDVLRRVSVAAGVAHTAPGGTSATDTEPTRATPIPTASSNGGGAVTSHS
jgi:regulator of protease activity HflC (stomatin/prohibitin superfamily)